MFVTIHAYRVWLNSPSAQPHRPYLGPVRPVRCFVTPVTTSSCRCIYCIYRRSPVYTSTVPTQTSQPTAVG